MTININAALADAVRVPLDSLHADAAYLIGRLQLGTMTASRVVEVIRERIDAAKAALTTAAAVPPEGWVMVPVEPTEEMIIAGVDASLRVADAWLGGDDSKNPHVARWFAMLASAPKAELAPTGHFPDAGKMVAQPAGEYPTLPLAITSAPERIWLDLGFNPYEEDAHFSNLHDLTWSKDNATGDGIEYVRVDLTSAPKAEPVPAGEYPPLPTRRRAFLCTKCGGRECEPGTLNETHPTCKCGYLGFAEDLDFTADEMRAYVDADRAMLAQAAPQPANEDEGITREQWIAQAMRVYLIAGDVEDDARECAKALCDEQNWDPLQDDLADPYDAAMSDVEGRGPAPQPAVQQGDGGTDIGQLGRRTILDAIRSAYDLGYSDARNARTHPGDSAPGYKGRDVEKDHGGALIAKLNVLAARPHPTAPVVQKEPTAWAVYDIKHGGGKSLHWNEQHTPEGDKQLFRAVPLYEAPVAQGDAEDAARLERERICAAIKAEDDYCVEQGDYMLDSDDCIKIVRGEWVRPDFSVDAARKQGSKP